VESVVSAVGHIKIAEKGSMNRAIQQKSYCLGKSVLHFQYSHVGLKLDHVFILLPFLNYLLSLRGIHSLFPAMQSIRNTLRQPADMLHARM
jgi:hypothetical protein